MGASLSRRITDFVEWLLLFFAGCGVIAACAAPPSWTIILAPPPVRIVTTRYVKVSGVWRPAQYFPRPPPTESAEKWGLTIECRPSIQISDLVTDSLIELPTSQPPPATLVYNSRQTLKAAVKRIEDEASGGKEECTRSFQVESLNISWDMAPTGMGYWDGEFEVYIKLALVNPAGDITSTHMSRIELIGLDSSSREKQAELTSRAGNDAVYGALVEGIDDLLSGSDR